MTVVVVAGLVGTGAVSSVGGHWFRGQVVLPVDGIAVVGTLPLRESKCCSQSMKTVAVWDRVFKVSDVGGIRADLRMVRLPP